MRSYKRRRSIAITHEIMVALKSVPGERVSSLAGKIVIGERDPVRVPEFQSGVKFISMRESLFLSIQARAERISESARSTFRGLLTGRLPPLGKEELAAGMELAGAMEALRRGQDVVSGQTVAEIHSENAANISISNSNFEHRFGGVHYF